MRLRLTNAHASPARGATYHRATAKLPLDPPSDPIATSPPDRSWFRPDYGLLQAQFFRFRHPVSGK
jgi:hypothetical protein